MKRLFLILAAGTIPVGVASGQVALTVGDFDADMVGEVPTAWSVVLSGGSVLVSSAYALSGSNSLAIDSTGAAPWNTPLAFQLHSAAPG